MKIFWTQWREESCRKNHNSKCSLYNINNIGNSSNFIEPYCDISARYPGIENPASSSMEFGVMMTYTIGLQRTPERFHYRLWNGRSGLGHIFPINRSGLISLNRRFAFFLRPL